MSESDIIGEKLQIYKNIQVELLNFLEKESNIEENFHNLNLFLDDIKLRDHQHELRLFLRLLSRIIDDHHRNTNFFSNVERILRLFKDQIAKYQKSEIFKLFEGNKRILLFLIEEELITVDEYFVKTIIKEKYLDEKYPQYFAPEIKSFVNEEWFPKYDPNDLSLKRNKWVEEINQELPSNFNELRNIGENESYLCKLIREDSIEKFISQVNRSCISRKKTINLSIYETNSYIIKKHVEATSDPYGFNLPNKEDEGITLIEYAAFFGSIQILTFLKNEGVELMPSLWIYAIHGKNAEMIHLLEEHHVFPENKSYNECFEESMKCHHNDFANYFLSNYLQKQDENSKETFIQGLKYYNLSFLQKECINESSFYLLCQYDYYSLVELLLSSGDVDINNQAIQKKFFLMEFKN